MTQEEINKAAEKFAGKNTDFTNDYFYSVFQANANGFKAGFALAQPEIERLKELVERYENALKSFGQSLTT